MTDLLQENNKQKQLFKSYYCAGCKQVKPCRTLWNEDWNYCCQCSYKTQKQLWTNYLTYEKALSYERQQRKEQQKNLCQLARGGNHWKPNRFCWLEKVLSAKELRD